MEHCCVVAGNKLTTLGTTWGLKSVKDLSKSESKAVQDFLKNKENNETALTVTAKIGWLYSMNKKVIIFDVDGTIANVEHRRHFVNQKPADWKSFRAETVNDTPVEHVCDIAKRFIAQGDEVAFFSARNESEREVTEKQISEWIGDGHKGLFLRPDGDFRPDEEFKSDLADKFEELGGKIDLVFDDRNKVVDMWRQRGTTVVQVAEGDFNGR